MQVLLKSLLIVLWICFACIPAEAKDQQGCKRNGQPVAEGYTYCIGTTKYVCAKGDWTRIENGCPTPSDSTKQDTIKPKVRSITKATETKAKETELGTTK
ncbi:MAG: hypothetical protein IPM02_26110 [Betaproteobacteria bacterium]|nr:hypothetical protein [Betaproteobacteria bacterium]